MNRKLYWGLAALIILILGTAFVLFIQHERAETQQLKDELAEAQKMLEDSRKPVEQVPVDFTKPPPGKSFEGGGHWHGDEWHDAPHQTPIVANNVPRTETIQVASVVIDGVGDLKEYLDYFESFGGDPPLEKHDEFMEVWSQYINSKRSGYQHETASEDVKKLHNRILDAVGGLQIAYNSKISAIERESEAKWSNKRFMGGPIGNNAGGDK